MKVCSLYLNIDVYIQLLHIHTYRYYIFLLVVIYR